MYHGGLSHYPFMQFGRVIGAYTGILTEEMESIVYALFHRQTWEISEVN